MTQHLLLASVTGNLTDWIGRHGAYAIFLIMAIDAVFPAASELAMLYAGALTAGAIAGHQPVLFGHTLHQGLESFIVMALAGTLGYLVGALIGWGIGRAGGRPLLDRHGSWLHLGPARVERAERWFDDHGRPAVLLGRITPIVRSFISIPAGAFGVPLGPYTALTLLGSALWCFTLTAAGWALGHNYDKLHHAFTGVEILVVVVIVLGALLALRGHLRGGARVQP